MHVTPDRPTSEECRSLKRGDISLSASPSTRSNSPLWLDESKPVIFGRRSANHPLALQGLSRRLLGHILTLFAWYKLPLKTYLMAIAVFCNEVKGKSMLAFSRDLDVQYKPAFGGGGQAAEIDGAYFGGPIRPENLAVDRINRRLAENQPGTRHVVVAMRERGGRTVAKVFPAEVVAVTAIRLRIAKGP
jgi:hypothetical protein